MNLSTTIIPISIVGVIGIGLHDTDCLAQTSLGIVSEESMKPSFVLTDANRLSAAQVMERIVGKQMVSYRRAKQTGVELRYLAILRSDGSFSSSCDRRPPATTGWIPCLGGRATTHGGSRDIGTWRIADPKGVICSGRTGAQTSEEVCTSYHQDGGRFAVKVISGRYVFGPGDVEIR